MIDLHVHSTASDGTFPPAELAKMGASFYAMALTDHDNCDGVAEFLAAAGGAENRFAGIELSVTPGEGYQRFHLLGLGIDPANAQLNALLKTIRAGRAERNVKILAKLAELGHPVTMDEVRVYAKGEIVARPHIARALVAKGAAADMLDAFAKFLAAGAPAYVPRYRPAPGEAFDAIHAAGGLAVMAHPKFWTPDPKALRYGLRWLKRRGLDGLEAVYGANTNDETVDHLRAAKELGLVVTAGSDFHGANKPTVTLGMTVDDERAFLAPFFAALSAIRG